MISICLLGAWGLRFFMVDISSGVLPDFIANIGIFGHKGFVCPLCGGCRSFVSVSGIAITEAFHYSVLGTMISLWILLTLPVRFAYYFFSSSKKCRKNYLFLRRVENPHLLLWSMAIFLWVQLGLHYLYDFPWIPLTQLK